MDLDWKLVLSLSVVSLYDLDSVLFYNDYRFVFRGVIFVNARLLFCAVYLVWSWVKFKSDGLLKVKWISY